MPLWLSMKIEKLKINNMTITLFVEPKSLAIFLQVTTVLKGLELDNNYWFTPSDLQFSETMISNWIWINMDTSEYLKLKYCMGKLSTTKSN